MCTVKLLSIAHYACIPEKKYNFGSGPWPRRTMRWEFGVWKKISALLWPLTALNVLFCALLGMPLIHKNTRNIFLQKLPILLHSNCFLQGKIAKARQCINRAIFEEKYFLYFYDVFSSWESKWSIKWVCEGCNTAEIFKIFKCLYFFSQCLVLDIGT